MKVYTKKQKRCRRSYNAKMRPSNHPTLSISNLFKELNTLGKLLERFGGGK